MATGDRPNARQRADELGRALRRNAALITLAVVALILVFESMTMFYRVDASDQGVVLRFGKHVRTTQPGLHFKWPWPIERVYEVTVQRVQVLEFGFATERAGRLTEYSRGDDEHMNVAEMLTGDLNLANVEWIVQFRVKDPAHYLFHIGTAEPIARESLPSGVDYDPNLAVPDTIRDVSESVLRTLVGDKSVDAVLTFDREVIASEAKTKIQDMLDKFEAGVEVVTVKLQGTSPPELVKDAFQEVNRARQNKERLVNEAEGERNSQIPAARGKKDQTISEAEGYRERIVLETEGRVAAFNAQLIEYEKAPEVTEMRLYLETMESMLLEVEELTILDDKVEGLLPLLNLGSEKPRSGNARPVADKGGVR